MPGSSYWPTPTTTAQRSGSGRGRRGGAPRRGLPRARSRMTVRISWRGVPSGSAALNTMVLAPGPEDQGDGEGEGALGGALGLLVDLGAVEEDGDPGDAAPGGEDRGEDGVLVGEAGLVFRIADGEGEGGRRARSGRCGPPGGGGRRPRWR